MLLKETRYPEDERKFLIEGFTNGFEIGYRGNMKARMTALNLKLNSPQERIILWNKVMNEVKLKRFAGPYKDIPFKETHYIQSPIGLVAKDGGKDHRLIFHLSYPHGKGTLVNDNTPDELCTVRYPDFNDAIKLCLQEGRGCRISRSDMKSAFRNLCIRRKDFWLLIMKAQSPLDGKTILLTSV